MTAMTESMFLAAAVELLAERAEDLEFDPVLRSSGGALHLDEVRQRRDVELGAMKVDREGVFE
jgi:hypothetical protein